MNERIKELEKQATNVVEGWSDENGTTRYYEFNREKFAELIVRDSIVDFYRRYLDTNSDEDITVQVERYIKEHFYGVEE